MECLGCNFIASSPVKLRDGRTVCSQCECWRLECEARYALGLPDRRAWLEKVRKRRGEEAYHLLRNEMLAIYSNKPVEEINFD